MAEVKAGWAFALFAVGGGLSLLRARLRALRWDRLLWLEEVDSDGALEWVRKQNERNPHRGDGPMYERLRDVFDSTDKIPFVSKINSHYYNFWKDAKHERGIWRRTTLDEYRKEKPKWETVLDLDALSEQEKEKWVWKGATRVDYGDERDADVALIKLSPGGGDAVQVREFDLKAGRFMTEAEQAFVLPTAKSYVSYKDRDTLLVGTDFGSGSMTSSGYPRIVKEWKRGTPLALAKTVFEARVTDMFASGVYMRERGGAEYQMTYQYEGFYSSHKYVHAVRGLRLPNGEPFELGQIKEPLKLALPSDAQLDVFADLALIELRSGWKGFKAGSLLSMRAVLLLSAKSEADISEADLDVLFEPTDRVALESYAKLKDTLVLQLMDNIKSRLQRFRYNAPNSKWLRVDADVASATCEIRSTECWAVDAKKSNEYWVLSESYVQPPALGIADATSSAAPDSLKQEKARFNADGVHVAQLEATSLDGTKVPYFYVGRVSPDAPKPTPTPTLLYGYGGFEIPLRPGYQITTGVCWLEKGFTYVCANIRGGGEFGPAWHQAALKANRNKAYEDFEAVARDLVRRGLTTREMLGIQGGSNGGLLMGNMLTRSPELFGAIVCQVPLLDMKRFSKLLAGASWMAEYGDPDTDDWDNFLHKYSPYHNIDAARARDTYPPILFTTSTRDDRVHPGHARKMAKRLIDLGAKVAYWENIEGGHGGSSTNAQRAKMWALSYEFLEAHLAGSKL